MSMICGKGEGGRLGGVVADEVVFGDAQFCWKGGGLTGVCFRVCKRELAPLESWTINLEGGGGSAVADFVRHRSVGR